MKKRHIALLASMVLISTNAQALWGGNLLFGVSGGGSWQNSDESFNFDVSSALPSSQLFAIHTDSRDNHTIWGFLAGFQAHWCSVLVGFEVNVDWRNDDDDDVNYVIPTNPILGRIVGKISRDRDPVVGLTTRFGYKVLPCLMPYIRLGVDYGRRETVFTGATTELVTNLSFSAISDEDERWGFVGGAGLEYLMPCLSGLSLRAEWDYHTRVHSDHVSALLNTPVPTSIGLSGGGQQNEQTARVSLVYNFCV